MTELEEYRELKKHAKENKMFGVAWKGALSEIKLKNYLQDKGFSIEKIEYSDNDGTPDFMINDKMMEHKRASINCYVNGDFRVEVQKSRKSGDCKSNRLYDHDFCDIVSIDVSEHTKEENDYRYILTKHLEKNKDFPNKIKALQRENDFWKKNVDEVLE